MTCLPCLGRCGGPLFPGQTALLASIPARPCPETPPWKNRPFKHLTRTYHRRVGSARMGRTGRRQNASFVSPRAPTIGILIKLMEEHNEPLKSLSITCLTACIVVINGILAALLYTALHQADNGIMIFINRQEKNSPGNIHFVCS